jgi:hypothetical protein
MNIEKYSIGVGDRFGKQAKAQLKAVIEAKNMGIPVVPVWNKSYREHKIVKSSPVSTKNAADIAVKSLGWNDSYYIDADHIAMQNVDLFIDSSNFFTIDVADFIGMGADTSEVEKFSVKFNKYIGEVEIPGIDRPLSISNELLINTAQKFLPAVKEAGKIYRYVQNLKGEESFISEISMDETDEPQTPVEMFLILAAISDQEIPLQTIAPKFTGRFNKGVDYLGNLEMFVTEFEQDILIINYAIREFNLPKNLKLSVHSGSDKFSLYPKMNKLIKKYDVGIHLKTAGTTWLEEVIGLASGGGRGLKITKRIYNIAYNRFEELCGPYATVIDIDMSRLPRPEDVEIWDSEIFVKSLRHDQASDLFNPDFRQLLHVGYKIAAEMGDEYLDTLDEFESIIAENVIENILKRHIIPIFK